MNGKFLMCLALLASTTLIVAHGAEQATQYVALGSSFAAGPGIAPPSGMGPASCGRSLQNYARKLAQLRQLELVDVSCGGATTDDLLDREQLGLKPQLEALSAATRLVTVTIGGNDLLYIGTMGAMACSKDPSLVATVPAKYCTVPPRAQTRNALKPLAKNLRRITAEVRRRAPQAQLIFVGYLPLLPVTGSCERLKLTAAEADWLRWVATELNGITRRAAARARADFMNAASLGRGHDVCSAEPWVNGFSATVPFHPNEAGMSAIANALVPLLKH